MKVSKILKTKKLAAFTLTELMVVLVIIGILVLIALPNFMGNIATAHQAEAKIHLGDIKSKQELYRAANFKYATSLEELNWEPPLGDLKYDYSIRSADKTTFVLEAKAKEDFDGDGDFNVLTLNEQNQLEIEVND